MRQKSCTTRFFSEFQISKMKKIWRAAVGNEYSKCKDTWYFLIVVLVLGASFAISLANNYLNG